MRRPPLNRLLLALGLLLATGPAFAAMQAKPIEWKVGKERFSGYVVYDDASTDKRPGLVMVPNWMGVTKDSVERAKAIAGDDYVILIADVYGKGNRPKDAKQAGALAGSLRGDDRTRLRARMDGAVAALKALAATAVQTESRLRARMQGALATLKAQAGKAPLDADRIGAFGFCFGGSAVLELARGGDELAGVVSLHGGLAPGVKSATAEAVKTPLLVLNGADDKAVPDSDILAFEKEMDGAGADWQFVDFSGAVHCFAEPSAGNDPSTNCAYDERAAKRAYRMMDDFFEERFGAAD